MKRFRKSLIASPPPPSARGLSNNLNSFCTAILLSMGLLITYANPAFGQNQLKKWCIPPNAIDIQNQTFSALPMNSYSGGSDMPSNLIYDKSGNLVLFVVGENIYDKNGYLIDNFSNLTNKTFNAFGEIAIIPAPCDCNYYWVVETDLDISGSPTQASYYTETYAALIDMNQTNPNLPNGMGIVIKSQLLSGGPCTGNHCAFSEIAVSPPKINQQNHYSYSLYIFNWEGLQKFNVECIGESTHTNPADYMLIYQDAAFYTTWSSTCGMSGEMNAEAELYPMANGTYRLALVSCQQTINIFDLDANGYVIQGSSNPLSITVKNFQGWSGINSITGLEFSENGQYLYFTSTFQTNNNPGYPYISYIDLNAINPSPTQLNVSNAIDFKTSFIELGYDHKLYFASSNRLATLDDSNLPTSIWTNNAMAIPVQGQPTFGSFNYYLLPDQIDGQNYDNIITGGYNFSSYTASGIATWTPILNPFNTNGGNTVYIENELRIPEGADITIQNMIFKFGPNGKVIVENAVNTGQIAGKLTLDNTVLTSADSACGTMWQGVRVWGVPWRLQNPNDPLAVYPSQGEFYMYNYSRIENAYTGLLLGKYGTNSKFDPAYGGGFTLCMNSEFRNNRVSVVLAPYNHNNYSTIRDGLFNYTNPLLNSLYEFEDFIRLFGVGSHYDRTTGKVDGNIHINDNVFTNGLYLSTPANKWGRAVYSYNSSMIFSNNIINNMFRGIDGRGIFNIYRFVHADNNTFNNTKQGILLRATINDAIDFNEFHVPDNTSTTINSTFAIKVDMSRGFDIVGNNIYTTQGYKAYGIIARESGSVKGFGGFIFMNNIYNNYRGIQSELFNAQLNIDCNYMENTGIGLSVNPQSPFGLLKDQGNGCNPWNIRPGNGFNIPCNNLPMHIRSTIDFKYFEDLDDQYPSDPLCVWNTWTNQQIVGYTSCFYDNKPVECVITNDTIFDSNILIKAYDSTADPAIKQIYWNRLFRAYIMESASDSILFSMLDSFNTRDGLYAKIGFYYDLQNYTSVQNILDTMTLNNADDSLFYQYYFILNSAAQDGRTLYALDSTDITALNNLVDQTASYMVTLPENTISYYSGQNYNTAAEDWGQNKKLQNDKNGLSGKISIYPVPADNLINIDGLIDKPYYNLLSIQIYDVSGKIILQGMLSELLTNDQINVSNLRNGIYSLSVLENNKVISSKKIVIIHD